MYCSKEWTSFLIYCNYPPVFHHNASILFAFSSYAVFHFTIFALCSRWLTASLVTKNNTHACTHTRKQTFWLCIPQNFSFISHLEMHLQIFHWIIWRVFYTVVIFGFLQVKYCGFRMLRENKTYFWFVPLSCSTCSSFGTVAKWALCSG